MAATKRVRLLAEPADRCCTCTATRIRPSPTTGRRRSASCCRPNRFPPCRHRLRRGPRPTAAIPIQRRSPTGRGHDRLWPGFVPGIRVELITYPGNGHAWPTARWTGWTSCCASSASGAADRSGGPEEPVGQAIGTTERRVDPSRDVGGDPDHRRSRRSLVATGSPIRAPAAGDARTDTCAGCGRCRPAPGPGPSARPHQDEMSPQSSSPICSPTHSVGPSRSAGADSESAGRR